MCKFTYWVVRLNSSCRSKSSMHVYDSENKIVCKGCFVYNLRVRMSDSHTIIYVSFIYILTVTYIFKHEIPRRQSGSCLRRHIWSRTVSIYLIRRSPHRHILRTPPIVVVRYWVSNLGIRGSSQWLVTYCFDIYIRCTHVDTILYYISVRQC